MKLLNVIAFHVTAILSIVLAVGSASAQSGLPCSSTDPDCYILPYHVNAHRKGGGGVWVYIPPLNPITDLPTLVGAAFGLGTGLTLRSMQNLIFPGPTQDHNGIIQTEKDYTICKVAVVGTITTSHDSTFNTTLLRVEPGKQNFDGLAYYIVAPTKRGKTVVVDATFAILYVKASIPDWFTKYKCMKAGDSPWLSRNNNTTFNVPGTIPPAIGVPAPPRPTRPMPLPRHGDTKRI